ncbi:hypothetical protein J3B02_002828, partial [Coemansia erecta]
MPLIMLSTSASRGFDEREGGSESEVTITVSEAPMSDFNNGDNNELSDDLSRSLSPSPAAGHRASLAFKSPYRVFNQPSGPEAKTVINEAPVYTSTVDWSQPIGPDDFLYRQQLSELRLRKQGITRVSIIDFDNTLFKSPLPNSQLWDASLIGMLKSTDLGWFQDSRTLSWPYLEYSENHWIETIETLTRLEAARSDTLLMLLTGRSHAAYRSIIVDLLARRKGLRFDIVVLKETPTRLSPLVSQTEFGAAPTETPAPLTFDYKMAVVEDTIAAFPEIAEIVMWDDRSHQCQKMQDYLDALQIRDKKITHAHVYHVPPQTIVMREENERMLVNDMIQEYNLRVRAAAATAASNGLLSYVSSNADDDLPVGSIKTTTYPSFTAAFLDRKSRVLLQKHVRSPRGWTKASSYMPLTVGRASPQELETMVGAHLGDQIELVADAMGSLRNSVIAVRISHVRINGRQLQL